MTLKTWLSITNVNIQKSKMSAGVTVLPVSNPHESPTRGCTLPTSCGPLKVRRHKEWKTRSVEDGLESSLEQGDYGFLEYFSLRQCNTKDYFDPPRSKVTPWNPVNSSVWGHGSVEWQRFGPTQFYPGTLSRQETSSRKRSRRDRPHSIHHESHHKCFFRNDDLRTSTPIMNPSLPSHPPSYKESFFMHSPSRDKPKHTSSGILKRNSVLAKLRPDKWKSFEGTLRRCRSRDDVLSSASTSSSTQKKNALGASQPDLLISHNACRSEMDSSAMDSSSSFASPPAPISILPPTCRHAPANVSSLSQTMPRRRRSSSSSNKENTLLARGRRWLTGATTNKENDRNKTNLMVPLSNLEESDSFSSRDGIRTRGKQPFSENVFPDSRKLVRGETFSSGQGRDVTPKFTQEKHPLEQMRCRRPLTFYLLEDYLSPVKGPTRVELDEYLQGKSPRILFNEAPHHRPLPPTPEWDIPSLSPPSSLISGGSRPQEPGGGSLVTPISPSGNGSSTMGDTLSYSSPEKVGYRIYSPLISSKGSEEGHRFVTPEQTLQEPRPRNHFSVTSPHTGSPHPTGSYAMSSLPRVLPNQPPSTVYTHLNLLEEKLGKPLTSEGGSATLQPHHPAQALTRAHSHGGRTHEPERRPSNAKERRRVRNCDIKYKSPGQQKESLQRLGRTGNTVKSQVQPKPRQNGLIPTQKLPVLAGSCSTSNSSTRLNLPLDNSRNGVSENDLLGIQGHASTGALPILNNNKGELPTNESPGNRFPNKNFEDTSPPPETGSIVQPMTPQEALKLYGDQLTTFEKREIESYPEIWYLGLEAKKIHGEEGAQLNGGYDDENGSYNKVMHDHISYRYEILEVIGKGSFGQVIRAIDHRSGEQVAIKIIRNKKRFHHQALVEVKILDHLRRKDKDRFHNVIHMFDYFYFRNHLCITFELMGLNLYELIKKNSYQGFGLSLIRRFAYSLVQCMRLLSKENIIHCDLKPENVLLKERGGTSIRVIDFGSSCYTHQRVYTYIQSRFYRSPEVILGLPYGQAIDMWSLGCILAELYTGYPLFPGENEVEQLACIMEAMGHPPQHLLLNASRRRLFFDSKGNPRCITNSKGKKRRPGSRDLSAILKSPDSLFIDFISRCLDWDPSMRLTPDEALQHEWLQSYSVGGSSTPSSQQSTSDRSSRSTANAGGSNGAARRPGPLTGDLAPDSDSVANQYRVYKNKKRDPSATRNQKGPLKSLTEGERKNGNTENSNTTNNNRTSEQNDITKDDLRSNPSAIVIDATSEVSLDDSGTYLPPIL